MLYYESEENFIGQVPVPLVRGNKKAHPINQMSFQYFLQVYLSWVWLIFPIIRDGIGTFSRYLPG